MRYVLTIAWLTLLWVLLWRDPAPGNVALGLVVAGVVVAATGTSASRTRHRVRPLAALRFLGHFLVKLVESNIVVAREVVTPQNVIETGIIGVPMDDCSDLVVTIVANAVSLTPGTLTLEVSATEPPVLYVHVLHLHDIEEAREDVRTLTRLVREALPVRGAPPAATTGEVR